MPLGFNEETFYTFKCLIRFHWYSVRYHLRFTSIPLRHHLGTHTNTFNYKLGGGGGFLKVYRGIIRVHFGEQKTTE